MLGLLFLAFLLIPALVWAQSAVDPTADLATFARLLLEAVQSGRWGIVASLVVVGLVFLLRTYGAKLWPALGGKVAPPVLAIVGSVAGAILTALVAGQPITAGLVLQALLVGFGGIGVFSAQKNILQARAAGKAAAAAVLTPAQAQSVLERASKGPNP